MTGLMRLAGAMGVVAIAPIGIGQVRFSLLDLGSLGGEQSYALGIDASGQVVGRAEVGGGHHHAFLYSAGAMADLGTLGGYSSAAVAINASGQVVGWSGTWEGDIDAFLFWDGGLIDLGSIKSYSSYAQGINASGDIVGFLGFNGSHLSGFLYSAGKMRQLSDLLDASGVSWQATYAGAINDSGVIVGSAQNSSSWDHAFVYSGGVLTDLGALLGSPRSLAQSINAGGDVVGTAITADLMSEYAFLYSGGVATNLGRLPGYSWSWAAGINASGETVGGCSADGLPDHAFICWGGTMFDLNGLLGPTGTGWTVLDAAAINDTRQIAATAVDATGRRRATLLTPVAGIAASVVLQNYQADVTLVPLTAELRLPGTTTVVRSQTVAVGDDGTFWFECDLAGTFDVAVKGAHWLKKKAAGIVLPIGGCGVGMAFTLANGDVNGDNQVNLADLTAIARAWRTTPGSPNWNPNADLNGDGSVNLADWTIASRNFRKAGD